MKTLLLSDLDGTITNKSLVLEHYGYLINKGIIEDNGSYSAWTEDMKNEKLIVQCAMSYQKAITGMRIRDLMVNDFIDEFIEGDNWHKEVLEILLKSAEFGCEVALITGSADFLVKPLCERFGFDCYATIYKTKNISSDVLTGEIIGMFAEEQKDNIIKSVYDLHLYNEVLGFGDTASDYGIFKHCDRNFLVEPTKETLEKLIIKGAKIEKIFK